MKKKNQKPNHHQQHTPLIHKPNNWRHKAYQPFPQVREFLSLHSHPHLLHFELTTSERVSLSSGRQKMCEMCSAKGVRLFWDIIKQADSINLIWKTHFRERLEHCARWAKQDFRFFSTTYLYLTDHLNRCKFPLEKISTKLKKKGTILELWLKVT